MNTMTTYSGRKFDPMQMTPEDVKRILEALARDNKIQQMKKELDDMENGENVDNSEEVSEAAGTDAAGEPEEDLSLMERIEEEIREKSDTNPDFSDIPEEIFRKLF